MIDDDLNRENEVSRAREIPKIAPIGKQLSVSYKNRQKAKLFGGKAKKALQDGDIQQCLSYIIEAIEPCDDSDALDALINSVQQKFPTSKKIKE